MRTIATRVAVTVAAGMFLAAGLATPQQGPKKRTSETVARPKKKAEKATEAELPPIPSEYKRKDKPSIPEGAPTFRADVTTVNVEVAVVDAATSASWRTRCLRRSPASAWAKRR